MKTKVLILVLTAILTLAAVSVVLADPIGPNSVDVRSTSKRTDFNTGSNQQVAAEKGNISNLYVNTTAQTTHWQGYYGDVGGTITLDNANNWTMYSWVGDIVSPTGTVLAATSAVTAWDSITCINWTNITGLETWYGMGNSDSDGIDETFTGTKSLTIGSVSLTNCNATNLYMNDSSQTQTWNETILSLNNKTQPVIFASTIEDGKDSFINGTKTDFQMVVGTKSTNMNYYFYIELN